MAINRRHIARAVSLYRADNSGGGQTIWPAVQKIMRPALGGNHAAKPFGGSATVQCRADLARPCGGGLCKARQHQRLAAQSAAGLHQARVHLLACKGFHHGHNFQRIARSIRQRLVHIGDQRGGFAACAIGGINQRAGQIARGLMGFHKGA